MDLSDQPKEIRAGEDLDAEKVSSYVRTLYPDLPSASLTIQQFPSGFSNLTYLITLGDREWVLRRPPFGTKAKTAHDMGREYRILKALGPVFPYCPKPVAYEEDPSILGVPFYLMERIQGIILRKDLPPGLHFTPAQARQLCENLLDVHVELHAVDYRKVGLEGFGKPQGYVERQVTGWSDRYRAARTPDAPDCEAVMAWIRDKMPQDTAEPAIIHNDFRFDNVVLDPRNPLRIIGVLDWEMATIGDPLMDLGNSLAYWVQSDDPQERQAIRSIPTDLPGALTRSEVIERYAQKSGRSVHNSDFYYCFGLFRLAVIAQQIYYRYYHGQTRDERFQLLIFAVQVLDAAAREVIARSTL